MTDRGTAMFYIYYEYASYPIELSKEEVDLLKAIYKGKKERDIKSIRSKIPKLYKRISKEVEDWAEYNMSHKPLDIDIYFPTTFRKLNR